MDRYILDFVNLNPGKNRLDVPCLDLLHYSQRSFLPNSDMDYVRESMESLRSGESLIVYNWNFPDLSELAFSLDSLTDSMSTAINSDEVEDALQRLGHRIEEPIEKAPPEKLKVYNVIIRFFSFYSFYLDARLYEFSFNFFSYCACSVIC